MLYWYYYFFHKNKVFKVFLVMIQTSNSKKEKFINTEGGLL